MVEIRAATADDYDAYARLIGELGVDDPIPSQARFTDELCARMIVATRTGVVIGYLLVEQLDGVGYIRNIVSDPEHRRTGVGVALMTAARERFLAAGAAAWCLNVKADNAAAIGLYERFGMRTAYRTSMLRLAPSIELPPRAPDLALTLIPAELDATIESRFHLLPGQLASARKRPGRSVFQLVRGEQIVGVCVFMRSIPGAFPFRLASPQDAATAIALLRVHVPAEASFVQLGVEDDDALVAEILGLGAVVYLELLHLRGALEQLT